MATLLKTWVTNYVQSNSQTPQLADAKGTVKVYLESQSVANNTSEIRIEHYATTYVGSGSGDFIITPISSYRANNGSYGGTYQQKSKQVSTVGQTKGTNVSRLLGTSYHTINHNENGTATLYVNGTFRGSATISAWDKTRSSAFNVALPTLPRATTINSFTWAKASGGAGLSRLTCNWSTAHSIDRIQYSLNGGSWTTASGTGTSGSFNISSLTPNTQYSLKIKVRRADSQVETESSVKSATTYDIAKITGAGSSYTINMGDAFNVAYTNPSGATTELSIYKTDGMTAVAAYRTITSSPHTYTPSAGEITAMYNLIPTTNSISLRIYIRTSDGLGNTYLNSVTRTFQVVDANPTFTTWTYEDLGGATTTAGVTTVDLTGNSQSIIKGYSNVRASVTTANKMVANKGASAVSYLLTIGSRTKSVAYSSGSTVTMDINAVTTNEMSVGATDSRGNTTPVSKTATTYFNYKPINITSGSAVRTDGIGEVVTLAFTGTYSNLNFGNVTNSVKTATFKYKKTTESSYSADVNILSDLTTSGATFNYNHTIIGDVPLSGFDALYSYNIVVTVTDELSTKTYKLTLGSGTPNIAISQNGVAINQAYDETLGGALQVNGTISSGKNKWFTNGECGLDLKNSDIVGANTILMSDEANGDTEGILFLKEGASSGSTDPSDYETLRGYRGEVFYNGNKILTTASDTGWITATLTDGFKYYGTSPGNTPKYRKIGNMVEINGAVSPTSDIAGSITKHEIFTLPEGFRPTGYSRNYIMQGSGTNIWCLSVATNGKVSMERYRSGDTYSTANTSAWLPFNATFFVD